MKKKKILKMFSTVLAVATLTVFAASCGAKDDKTGSGSATTSEDVAPRKDDILDFNIATNPKTMDPILNADMTTSQLIGNLFRGLYTNDLDAKAVIPAVAKDHKISDDGLVYTFNLRKDAKWSDGKGVTAKDFVFAWLRGMDPATAAEYSTTYYPIKGARAFTEGTGTKEEVGVKALDDYTLEVTLEAPTAYFIDLMSRSQFMPLREDIVGTDVAGAWTLDPKTYVSNGPYKLTEWVQDQYIDLEKNPEFYDASKVSIEKVHCPMIIDDNTAYTSFLDGSLDYNPTVPIELTEELFKTGVSTRTKKIGTYYVPLNVSADAATKIPADNAKVLADVKVRKALSLAINRQDLVDFITKGGEVAATSFVPEKIVNLEGKEFSKEYYPAEGDIEEAKKLLKEAGYENGTGFPKLTYGYNTSEAHKAIGEFLQAQWKENLGIEVELANSEWAVWQNILKNKEYQIGRMGWIADYNDPYTMLELLSSDNANNTAGYASAEYDKLIKDAAVEEDLEKREKMLKDAEDLLMEDAPVIPLYFYSNNMLVAKQLKGFEVSVLGNIYFDLMSWK